jgi:hypothetical protein
MANTFHRWESAGAELDRSKTYLQQDPSLRSHPIWREEGFWDSALFQGTN